MSLTIQIFTYEKIVFFFSFDKKKLKRIFYYRLVNNQLINFVANVLLILFLFINIYKKKNIFDKFCHKKHDFFY